MQKTTAKNVKRDFTIATEFFSTAERRFRGTAARNGYRFSALFAFFAVKKRGVAAWVCWFIVYDARTGRGIWQRWIGIASPTGFVHRNLLSCTRLALSRGLRLPR